MKNRALNNLASALVALSAFFFISGFCLAQEEANQSSAQPVTIGSILGRVEVLLKDEQNWQEAQSGDQLNEGDNIRTIPEAKAELIFEDGSFMGLKEKTALGLKSTRQDVSTQAIQYNLDFRVGEIMLELKKLQPGSSFKVETPTAVAAVRGTTFYMRTGTREVGGRHLPFTDLYVDSDDIVDFFNLISKLGCDVRQGEGSSSYGDGTIDEPRPLSSSARDAWKSGWDILGGGDTGKGSKKGMRDVGEEAGDSDDLNKDVDDTTGSQNDAQKDANQDRTGEQDITGLAKQGATSLPPVSPPTAPETPPTGSNTDSDGDGMPDEWEDSHGLDSSVDDADKDPDGDNLINLAEYQNDTDPQDADSDQDNLDDGEEVNEYATNPNLKDTDGDGLRDGYEKLAWMNEDMQTEPLQADSEDEPDGILDGDDAFPRDPDRQGSRSLVGAELRTLIEKNDLREDIQDMLTDVHDREIDAAMERVTDAQIGKILTDVHGNRVRVEQYVLRPNPLTVQLLNVCLRTAPDSLQGLHTLDWTTVFNSSLDSLNSNQIKNLHWDCYLNSYGTQITSPETPGEVYPSSMSIKLAHNGDFIKEVTAFGTRTNATQAVNLKKFSYNLSGFGSSDVDFGGPVDIKNLGLVSVSSTNNAPITAVDKTSRFYPEGYNLSEADLSKLSSDDGEAYTTKGFWMVNNNGGEYLTLVYADADSLLVPPGATIDSVTFKNEYAANWVGVKDVKLIVGEVKNGDSFNWAPVISLGNILNSPDQLNKLQISFLASSKFFWILPLLGGMTIHDYALVDVNYSLPVIQPVAGTGGNPGGFRYFLGENGTGERYIDVSFNVIADAGSSAVAGFSDISFNTLGDALMAKTDLDSSLGIGANNLEISIRPSSSDISSPAIDLIYVPIDRLQWNDRTW